MSVVPELRRSSSFSALVEEFCRNDTAIDLELANLQCAMQASDPSSSITVTTSSNTSNTYNSLTRENYAGGDLLAAINISDFDEETLGVNRIVPQFPWLDETTIHANSMWDTNDLSLAEKEPRSLSYNKYRDNCPSPLSFHSCSSPGYRSQSEHNLDTSSHFASLPTTPSSNDRHSFVSSLQPPMFFAENQFVFPPFTDHSRSLSLDSLQSVNSVSLLSVNSGSLLSINSDHSAGDSSDNVSESSLGVGEMEDLLESTVIQPSQIDSDCRFPSEVYIMPTKDLNQYVKLLNLTPDDVREIKATRRKLKSRVYARRNRQRQKIMKTMKASA